MNITEFQIKKDEFITHLKNRNHSENTYKSYTYDFNRFTEFWQNQNEKENRDIGLEEAAPSFIEKLEKENFNLQSQARKISCFNSFKKYLSETGIKLNISLKRPTISLQAPQTLTIAHVTYILDQVPDEVLPTKLPLRDKAIVELIYATGVRVSELVSIELGHINFDENSIIIRSKRLKERVVFFGKKAHERIIAYLKFERKTANTQNERLFLNFRSTPLTERSVQRICKMFSQFFSHGHELTPCLLRHSFAAHLLEKGADINTVQELLGHKTVMSTQRYKKVA